jgi:hypothetical protein
MISSYSYIHSIDVTLEPGTILSLEYVRENVPVLAQLHPLNKEKVV